LGAKRKRKGDWDDIEGIEEGGIEVTGQSKETRISAEPDEEVAARFPCCRREANASSMMIVQHPLKTIWIVP
jgi:hypothetical protein